MNRIPRTQPIARADTAPDAPAAGRFLPAVLSVAGQDYRIVDLPGVFGEQDYLRLPVVLRLLLENAVRCMRGAEREAAVAALRAWLDAGTSQAEIAFQPGRVLMHDTTSTPALVDIAAMRDALAEAGADPALLHPVLPVDVSVDHSLAVEAYALPDAAGRNMAHEIRRNRERYRFLRWAAQALHGVHINPPGTGIMHTINLEQLATVVRVEGEQDSSGAPPWLVPDMMIGTDSHTPMINGIGVLGWGVGGLEAQTVMFGLPTMLRIPDVVGVELTGALRPGVLATDLALVATQRLRALGVAGDFVEFFGPGVSTLAAGERAVVANMAPEYGATTGYFPVDAAVLDYLRATGRAEDHVARVRAYARRAGIWFDPQARPRYSRVIRIDLDSVGMHVAGPRRPQDLHGYGDVPGLLAALDGDPDTAADGVQAAPVAQASRAAATSATTAPAAQVPQAASAPQATSAALPRFPVAIAAITSCTNTSDPGLLMAAGLLARKARARGLRVPPWVKTSLGPGSPAAASYLRRAGLMDDLSAVGFDIVGYGCTTCIGNSGPLPAAVAASAAAGRARPVAMLSGNRNFPGRIHPDLDLGFLMSPPLVVAYALAGDAGVDLSTAALGRDADGRPVRLRELWPTREEVAACLRQGLDPADYRRDFAIARRNPLWHALDAPASPRFPWDPASTQLRRPPFAAADAGSQLGRYTAYPLLVLGDDITTDHISPASAIPPDSLVADFLVERGEDRHDLNVFASRRGNWEVMMRAAFHSKTLVNRLCPEAPVAHTLHVPSGEILPIWEAARRYEREGHAVVLVAGERYGTGSSRDWAAKGQRLLGVRAVLASSFERIHRSNLIGMGILPLILPPDASPDALALAAGDRLEIDAPPGSLRPRADVEVVLHRADGRAQRHTARAAVETGLEIQLLEDGGVIPMILRRTLGTAGR
ncbi:aconitate hydratase [Bordetella genomosp. 10]|uniref:Aconitate hydratase A n=1 Tax=Bordetella genomosp. 10 TaxID=1416804 RepID=A0A261SPD4_9BORD|nr:aconitate hydratase AcnA [Bordetella genomosp. 10]OZI38690.1 aconitate hydratase [Bordetella genomosp. 10]